MKSNLVLSKSRKFLNICCLHFDALKTLLFQRSILHNAYLQRFPLWQKGENVPALYSYVAGIKTNAFTHSVASLTGLMMPILVILSSSAFNLFFNVKEIFLEDWSWETEGSTVMWCVVLKVPISPEQSQYYSRNASRFVSVLKIHLVSWSFLQVSVPRMACEFVSAEHNWRDCIFVNHLGYECTYNRNVCIVVSSKSNWGWLQF